MDTTLPIITRYSGESLSLIHICTEAIEIATPPIPDAESWSTIERLNRERELVGIYLSAHPLDEYLSLIHISSSGGSGFLPFSSEVNSL